MQLAPTVTTSIAPFFDVTERQLLDEPTENEVVNIPSEAFADVSLTSHSFAAAPCKARTTHRSLLVAGTLAVQPKTEGLDPRVGPHAAGSSGPHAQFWHCPLRVAHPTPEGCRGLTR